MREYEIIRKVDTIKDWGSTSKEVNIVKWGDMEPMIDIRKWKAGEPGKGITLTKEEAKKLVYILLDELIK